MPQNCRGFWHKDYGYLVFKGEVWQNEITGVWYGAFEADYMGIHVNLALDDLILDYI